MKFEDPKQIEEWKKAEKSTTMMTYGKYTFLGLSLLSVPALGLNGVNTAMIIASLGLLSFDRSITKLIKMNAINNSVEMNMINLDIQK